MDFCFIDFASSLIVFHAYPPDIMAELITVSNLRDFITSFLVRTKRYKSLMERNSVIKFSASNGNVGRTVVVPGTFFCPLVGEGLAGGQVSGHSLPP